MPSLIRLSNTLFKFSIGFFIHFSCELSAFSLQQFVVCSLRFVVTKTINHKPYILPPLSYFHHITAPYIICNTPNPNVQKNKPEPRDQQLITPNIICP